MTATHTHASIGECANVPCDGAHLGAKHERLYFFGVPGSMNAVDKDDIFKALSSPIRRKILCWLKDVGIHFPGSDYPPELGASANQINRRSGLSQSAMSSHLAILLHAELVTAHKSGTWVFFKRNEEAIDAFLVEIRSQL